MPATPRTEAQTRTNFQSAVITTKEIMLSAYTQKQKGKMLLPYCPQSSTQHVLKAKGIAQYVQSEAGQERARVLP